MILKRLRRAGGGGGAGNSAGSGRDAAAAPAGAGESGVVDVEAQGTRKKMATDME